MQMRMGLSLAVRPVLGQSLSTEQRIEITSKVFTLHATLIQALRDEQYDPVAKCPSCRRELSPGEILKGFKNDPKDFTTGCPKCRERFEPRLICFGKASRLELPFFCAIQALDQMRNCGHFSPTELAHKHPAVYRAAIAHFGCLKVAFAKVGINYPYVEDLSWESKVGPFLGKLTDRMIANCCGVAPAKISKLRKQLGIPRADLKKLMQAA